MIVDHRTYTCHPGKLKSFVDLYEKMAWPLQMKYLENNLGWYTSMDIGQLNQVVHLWAFKDLADRAERRARMQADPAFGAYLAEATQYLVSMENKILSPTGFFDLDELVAKS